MLNSQKQPRCSLCGQWPRHRYQCRACGDIVCECCFAAGRAWLCGLCAHRAAHYPAYRRPLPGPVLRALARSIGWQV